MTRLIECGRLRAAFLAIFLSFTFQGAHCLLLVAPAGSTLVNAVAGTNVTLAVSISSAPDSLVTWLKGDLPVVTWTLGSNDTPDVADAYSQVLGLEPNGSLTFVNVPLSYNDNYTIEITKSGFVKALSTFTLKVFDTIQNVVLNTQPDFAIEGAERFTLRYSMQQGVVEQQMWFFNGMEINAGSHYLVETTSLVILGPNRNDTGQYAVLLTNPFSSVKTDLNVTVLYGPDEPLVEVQPALPFYVSGDSLRLSCQAEGFPQPTARWVFGGHTLSDVSKGVLNLKNVQSSQGGVYTCVVLNNETKEEQQKSMILKVYESPPGDPMCSVQAVNNVQLQYYCQWSGGTPEAVLSFPALSNASSGAGNFSLTVASENMDRKTVVCVADHQIEQNRCNVTASRPVKFLPAVRTTVNSDGKIVVTIHCVSEASPHAVVSWFRGSEAVTPGTAHQISSDTTQLEIRHRNVSNFLLQNYTCICRNPLGAQSRETQLRGPSISDSSLVPNQDGTIVTLTWEVPPTSVVTGFDIQMKGPVLPSENRINGIQIRGSSNGFRTIRQKPGSARSTDIFDLDPNLTYRFRIIPKVLLADGEPSEAHRVGPGDGLSGSAIAGIAAGIPCGLLLLLLLPGLVYLCVHCSKSKSRLVIRYPGPRAAEKTITTQTDSTPHNLRTGGFRFPPDYNRLQQTPSERSVALPTFVPPPPVRVATTV